MKYFSTFSGAGGFELGIEYANTYLRPVQQADKKGSELCNDIEDEPYKWQCVGFSEIDKYASAVLKYHYPNIKNYGDIKTIDWSAVPNFDLLVGGSPCQDLSVAGKRAGLTGERSGLFAEFIRALQEKKPTYFIWENVKGALSSNQGWDFAEVQAQMAECGYELWWQVLNAKDFGVPQNRERIFVVGVRGGSPREVLFERGTDEEGVIANTIRTGSKGSLSKKHAWDLIAQPVLTPDRLKKRQNGRRMKENGEPSFTLTGQDKHGVYNGKRIRRLTPVECEALMSWPKNWTRYGDFDGEIKEISDTQRYKMCGNGVVSEVVKHLIQNHINPKNL